MFVHTALQDLCYNKSNLFCSLPYLLVVYDEEKDQKHVSWLTSLNNKLF